jgi:hypothetical protein
MVALVSTAPADTLRLMDSRESAAPIAQDSGRGAARDTVVLIGPWGTSAQANGQFQNAWGDPAWNGWTHRDLTTSEESHWSVSDYQADNLGGHGPGNLAAWCGSLDYPSCGSGDEAGGYGNNYHELLTWTGTVAKPAEPCTVTVEARLNLDLGDVGYDYLSLLVVRPDDSPLPVTELTGKLRDAEFSETFVVQPVDYHGTTGSPDEVILQFRVTSDGAYSDEDCFRPGMGACQLDDIRVTLSNGASETFSDFQSGTWGHWTPDLVQGVGDFTHIHPSLEDYDLCVSNYTPQVNFIDDGIVIPETGGTVCLSWCYGPMGYIVNNDGGLAGPDHNLHNKLLSPVVTWPETGAEGARLEFSVYEHENLGPDSPGIFYTWHFRSTASADPADIETAPWRDHNYIYYGGPGYRRFQEDVTGLLVPGARFAQVSLDVRELGYGFGLFGDDGTPAPYFDNVRLVTYPASGPAISVQSEKLAQDGFPAGGILDTVNEEANSVRFDMAQNIAPSWQEHIVPGDSVVVTIATVRAGAELVGMPQLSYRLLPNPAFDDYRTSGLPLQGAVDGWPVSFAQDRFAFDLPDTGFFFPGDVLHYFISATSLADGVSLTTTMPADTTGFSDFSGPLAYNETFTVRALPSVWRNHFTHLLDDTPPILLWADGGDLEDWVNALTNIDKDIGVDYDLFRTRAPSAGVDNGLGSRATPELLSFYRTLLYDCGDLQRMTLADGNFELDGSDDLALLDAWMQQPDKSLLAMGDNLVQDLNQSTDGQLFMENWLKVAHDDDDLRPLIGNQVVPGVVPVQPPGIFYSLGGWVAYGGCPEINSFDAIEALSPGVRIAEFTSPGGQPGMYSFAAAVLHDLPEDKTAIPDHNSAVITLPHAFEYIYADQVHPIGPPLTARAAVLYDILNFFGEIIIWGDAGDLPDRTFVATNYPNPFNPRTLITYNLPQAGHLSLKIYDARGRVVNTLVDEVQPAGAGEVYWDGRDHLGRSTASGVYFYEVKTSGKTLVNKMTLLR